jgi:hypothetical protein
MSKTTIPPLPNLTVDDARAAIAFYVDGVWQRAAAAERFPAAKRGAADA